MLHRPVPLSEHAVFQGTVFALKKLTPSGELDWAKAQYCPANPP
jgi:hypothetical protein